MMYKLFFFAGESIICYFSCMIFVETENESYHSLIIQNERITVRNKSLPEHLLGVALLVSVFSLKKCVNFHMVCPTMINWILCHFDFRLVITKHLHWFLHLSFQFIKYPFESHSLINDIC